MRNLLTNPSVYAHFLNGFLLFFAISLLLKHFSKLQKLEPYKIIIMILLFATVIGIHGLSHLGLESVYHYNPIQNLFFDSS
jgi:hypothetical protein